MSEKPQLPFGWVVKQSKSYPDRVYYFNINSGASTWEFPDLIKSYNVTSAGPVSPPILSATSFNPGSAQSPTKFPPEPTFSPQLSDSDNDGSLSGKSPGLQNKQVYGQANHQVPFTLNQRTGSGYGPPQTQNYPQYGATRLKDHVNERPGLLGPYPHVTSPKHDRAYQGYGTPIHGTSKLVTSPVPQQFWSGQTKALLKTPTQLSKTPVSCSNVERPKALSPKNLDSFLKASTSQSFSNKCVNKPSESVNTNTTSKDKASCSGQNAYNKAIKILSKSVEKTVNQLGKLVNIQGSKSDTPTNSGSGVTQKKSLILSGNQRKPMEKDINDNIKSSGKKRQLDQDISSSEKDVKKKRLDKSIEVVVQSKVPGPNKIKKQSASPVKKVESKSVKRKSSEILPRDSKEFDLNDSTDRRKVVKSSATDPATSRSVVIKNTPIKFGTDSSTVSEDLKVQASVNISQNVPGSCRSFTRQVSEDSNLSLELPDDPDQSGILRQFIGDKDKLLSIQSWIDNLRDGAGSSTASVDSFGESVSGDADDKRVVISDKSTDSGYLSPPLQTGSKTERGWPGEAKKCDISSREITAMEIDDIPLPETDVKFQEEDMVIDLMLSEVREQMKSSPEKVCGTLTATVAELQEFLKEQDNQDKLIGSKEVDQTGEISSSTKQLYIVIDTNVIISDLLFIQDLKDMEFTGFSKPVLYIPWIVLQELDSLKQACTKGMPKLTASTQNKASRGIKMLQHMFRIKHPQIKGQTPMESQEAARVFRADCNDDIILMTCLHYRKNCAGAEVVLLTNDNNLINKALVCGVNAYNRRDLLSGLEKLKQITVPSQSNINIPRPAVTPKKFIPVTGPVQSTPATVKQYGPGQVPFKPIPGPSTSAGPGCIAQGMLEEERSYTEEKLARDIHCKLKGLLKAGFGKVLQTEMELAYSDMWKEIVYRKPPWSLKDILDSMKKHWIAVFGLVFQRALVKQVDYLIQNFKEEKVYRIEDLAICCREAVVFLDQCVRRNMYGSAIVEVKESVERLQQLCDSICKGETNVKSISSLENYLKLQPSSQPQKLCDNKGENLHLVNKQCHNNKTNSVNSFTTSVSPHSGIMNNNSTQPQSGGRSHNSSVPSSTVKDGNQPVQAPVSWELAASKLQKIWQHIYSCCDEMRKMLNSGMGEDVLSAVEKTLSLLVPAAKEIRTEYVVVLQIPLSQLPGHMDKIGRLANQCNNYFSNLQLNDEGPAADAECFLALFRNGQQRESLNMFLKQLDEMLCHLYKCLHHLDPGD